MRAFVLLVCGVGAGASASAWAADKPPVNVLLFTKSSGYEHAVVRRNGVQPSLVERTFAEWGTRRGWLVTSTKDGALIAAGGLRGFDVVVFETTGDLATPGTDGQPPVTAQGKTDLLAAVRAGKGFVGLHCAADTFHSSEPQWPGTDTLGESDPYIAMLGGEFMAHGDQQELALVVPDPQFPGLRGLAALGRLREEWYSLKRIAPDSHVLLALDTTGAVGPPYARPRYPVAWARRYGRGRVVYTALGHREEVWAHPAFAEHVAGAVEWAAGRAGPSQLRATVAEVTPDANRLPPPPPARK